MPADSVLRVNAAEEREDYRSAVAMVITGIQAETGATHIDIAEKIGVSLGTISNAANKKTDLCHTYLDRLGNAYGCHVLNPIAKRTGARMVPLDPDETIDALPSTTAAIHKLAVARSPNSPGGDRILHRELLNMEPEIDAAIRALTALKCRCEKVRAA